MYLFLIFLHSFVYPPGVTTAATTLTVEVSGLEVDKGSLNLALFPAAGDFPEPAETTLTARFAVTGSRMTYRFTDLPQGQYALAVYQDVNDNGKLDKNGWGVPQEPYCFSSGAVAKWRAPNFAEAAFPVNSPAQQISLVVKPWQAW